MVKPALKWRPSGASQHEVPVEEVILRRMSLEFRRGVVSLGKFARR